MLLLERFDMVVDSDVIIRFLTNDDSQKASRFERYLKTGKKIILTDVTFAEIYWTLASFYQFPKNKILNPLEALVNHKSIICQKNILEKTIQILKEYNISLIDAYNAAYASISNEAKILSFDKGLGKIKNLTRVEP